MSTQNYSNGKYVFELFPQEYIDLDKELKSGFHTALEKILNDYAADEIDIKLSQIAAYCEVVLEGDYTLEDRIVLCRILIKKLEERRIHLLSAVVIS